MKIKASCGNAPKSESLETSVYSVTLTATTQGERRWLAGLLATIQKLDMPWITRLRNHIPVVRVLTEPKAPRKADAARE